MNRLMSMGAMLLALVLGSANAAAQNGPVLKFASFPPARAGMNKLVLGPWSKELNAAAGGSFTVKLFMGGSLGRNPLKQLKLVKDRVADLAFVAMAYTPGDFPDQSVFELPFMFQSSEEGALTHWKLHQQGLLKGYDRVKWTALFTMTPYSLHSRTPIRSLDDFKGKKIRTAGPIQAQIVKSLGATPVGGMHIAKVAESLSRGVVDGTLAEWNGMVAFRIADAAKYHFDFPFTTVAVGTAMNKESFAKLGGAAQTVFDKHTGAGLSVRHGKVFDQTAARNLKRFRANKKHQFYTPTDKQKAELRRRLEPIIDGWVAARPGRAGILAAARKIVGAARK